MRRYIDANLISYEQRERLGLGIDYRATDRGTYEIAYKSQIDRIPAADVAEVRRGEWIKIRYRTFICSHCKRSVYLDGLNVTDENETKLLRELYPYCHCGARNE